MWAQKSEQLLLKSSRTVPGGSLGLLPCVVTTRLMAIGPQPPLCSYVSRLTTCLACIVIIVRLGLWLLMLRQVTLSMRPPGYGPLPIGIGCLEGGANVGVRRV